MRSVLCPRCQQPAHCVDSQGYVWRCYGHGEYTFDVRGQGREQQAAAAEASADLRAQSQVNALQLLGRYRN